MGYLPETSTSVFVPVQGINVLPGALGNWATPAGALDTTGATVSNSGIVGESSKLLCANAPVGVYAPINNGAKINKFVLNYEVTYSRTNTFFARYYAHLLNGATIIGAEKNAVSPAEIVVWTPSTVTFDSLATFPAGITGAQLKQGTYGPGFYLSISLTNEGAALGLRNITMQVFYQNSDIPDPVISDYQPLLFCEV